MAHSLAPVTPPIARPISRKPNHFLLASSRTLNVSACATRSDDDQVPEERNLLRRSVIVWGVAMPLLGLISNSGGGNAWAAARRPPPPPPKEKKDPNLSGAAAKVLASKKRKEAMKEFVAKQRDKGKIIDAAAQPAE